MNNPDRLHRILTEHDAALAHFREASDAFDTAVAGCRTILEAISRANHAQGEAIVAMLAANRLALEILNDQPDTP